MSTHHRPTMHTQLMGRFFKHSVTPNARQLPSRRWTPATAPRSRTLQVPVTSVREDSFQVTPARKLQWQQGRRLCRDVGSLVGRPPKTSPNENPHTE